MKGEISKYSYGALISINGIIYIFNDEMRQASRKQYVFSFHYSVAIKKLPNLNSPIISNVSFEYVYRNRVAYFIAQEFNIFFYIFDFCLHT